MIRVNDNLGLTELARLSCCPRLFWLGVALRAAHRLLPAAQSVTEFLLLFVCVIELV